MGWGQDRHSVCFQGDKKKKQTEDKVSAAMQSSDGTRPLLSGPNPRARPGNGRTLDEMNDERDEKKKKKSGAATRQKDGVRARIKRNLDQSANISGGKKRCSQMRSFVVFPSFRAR